MLLGLILEKQMGDRLDRLARDYLFAPLGIDELHFCPIDEAHETVQFRSGKLGAAGARKLQPPAGSRTPLPPRSSAPGESGSLCGEVDDENAWALNGVAGHAGLFGTARGVFETALFLVGHL